MRIRDAKLAVLIVGCCATLALAATYTWIGEGADDDWDTCENWEPSVVNPCYPANRGGDATIPSTEGTWAVDLISVQIDDLTINGSVTFGAAEDGPTLCVDSVTIGSNTADVTATVTDVARIETDCT